MQQRLIVEGKDAIVLTAILIKKEISPQQNKIRKRICKSSHRRFKN